VGNAVVVIAGAPHDLAAHQPKQNSYGSRMRAEMRPHASLGAHARAQTINARHGGNGIHDQGIEGASKPRSMARQWALPKGGKRLWPNHSGRWALEPKARTHDRQL